MHHIWRQASENLEKVLEEQDFATWIKPVSYSHCDSGTLFLSVPHLFFRDWLKENYSKLLLGAVKSANGSPLEIDFVITDDSINPEFSFSEELNTPTLKDAELVKNISTSIFTPLNTKYTFDLFVSGTGNHFAHAAATAVANNPADTYNPLFIYGGVGLGKSHLLNAIGHTIRANSPNLNLCYCSAEKFTYEMINSLQHKKMEQFRAKFRNLDVLLIDDIQFISRKTATQEELFYTFNSLYDAHRQIVITSDKFPREIPDLEERLRSRFEWGLIADIQPPDLETKIAILKKKSESNRIRLPDDVTYFLASSDTRNIRELEGMLIRLGAYSSLQGIPITLEMARENLKDILVDKRREVTVDLIQKTVSEYFGLKIADIKSEKRHKNIVQARQIAFWLCRDMTKASYPDIGQRFGGKDHSTVIHAAKKIDKLLHDDSAMIKIVSEIKELLNK